MDANLSVLKPVIIKETDRQTEKDILGLTSNWGPKELEESENFSVSPKKMMLCCQTVLKQEKQDTQGQHTHLLLRSPSTQRLGCSEEAVNQQQETAGLAKLLTSVRIKEAREKQEHVPKRCKQYPPWELLLSQIKNNKA